MGSHFSHCAQSWSSAFVKLEGWFFEAVSELSLNRDELVCLFLIFIPTCHLSLRKVTSVSLHSASSLWVICWSESSSAVPGISSSKSIKLYFDWWLDYIINQCQSVDCVSKTDELTIFRDLRWAHRFHGLYSVARIPYYRLAVIFEMCPAE